MKLNRFLIIGLTIFIAGAASYAQGDTIMKFSLSQAQDYAVENFYSSKNAQLDMEKAKKVIQETRAIGLPQITASGAFQYTPEISKVIEGFLPPGTNLDDLKWGLNGTVTASQLIFSGSYIVALQSTKVYKNLSTLSWAKSVQDVREAVKNSYFNVLIARENLQILDSTYQNMVKVNADMKAFANQGLIDQTDADQMELTVTSLKTTRDYVTRMADVAEKYLKIQLGLDINAKLELSENLIQLMNNITIENLIVADFVLENNVDYQMLATSEKSAELLLKLSKTNYLPTVAGFYQYYKEFNDNAFSFTPPHVIGVNVSIPIFTSGSNGAKVSQAKIDLLKAQETKNQLSNALKLDFYNSKSQLMAAKDKYDANTKNMALAKKIYNNSLEKYKLGMISSTDLTQVQNQYLQAQTNYYTSLQELIAASDKLEKLLTPNTQQ